MMKVIKNLFGKKNESLSTYGAVENLLVNLTGDVVR